MGNGLENQAIKTPTFLLLGALHFLECKLKFLGILTLFLLIGCATLETNSGDGLIKIDFQQLIENEECTGKGVEVYSAWSSNKHFRIETINVFVSPGNWTFAYFPQYQVLNHGTCEALEEIITHGEFTATITAQHGYVYELKLNNENVAYFEKSKM